MRRATVIIGAAWGDEGKGLLTDAFSDADTLVVRFNGGAQAGHTVTAPDGRRHVFHHIGSGSFRGARTFLSRFFISNPLAFFPELDALAGLGAVPVITADPAGMVTTPYDMMLNQMIEESRGPTRHGSCGLGVNETVTRHPALPLTVGDLSNRARLETILRAVRQDWTPRRLDLLGLVPSLAWRTRLANDAVADAFLDAAQRYADRVTPGAHALAAHSGPVVFEGAQGLLLDEEHRWFPHVTRGRTGLTNVDILAREAGIAALDAVHATRAYATRHGAGPFPREVARLSYEDRTNVPNMWQETLRFGHLDLDLLGETIRADLARATLPVRHSLAVTCLDQVGEQIPLWHEGQARTVSPGQSRDLIGRLFAARWIGSHGPTRDTLDIGAVPERP